MDVPLLSQGSNLGDDTDSGMLQSVQSVVFYLPVDDYRPFVERLTSAGPLPDAFNPYAGEGPAAVRRNNLMLYLARMAKRQPRVLLVGEAPGYRGGRVTGVPFTSEAILLGAVSPFGLFGAAAGFRGCQEPGVRRREATATVVWEVLADLNQLPLLWNAFPYHPHRPDCLDSNRTPTAAELAVGQWAIAELLRLYAITQVVAIGRRAEKALALAGIPAAAVRHPAHGGKTDFARELGAVLRQVRA